jgi:8-oxo-dGTP pyrophosphatase MutT (NUDIX family)
MEETNLKITIKGALGLAEFEIEPVNVICVILEAKKSPGDIKLSDEHIEYEWVYPDAIMNMDVAEWFHPFLKSYLQNKHKCVD